MALKPTPRTAGLLLLLYMTLAGVWVWRLAPRPAPPSDDLRVEQQERIAAFLAKAPKDTAMPALMRLARMPDADVQVLDSWLDLPPLEQVRQLTVQKGEVARLGPDWAHALMQTWLAHGPVVNLDEAHLMIAAAGERLSDSARHESLQQLARLALRHGESDDAVTILGRACELPGASWDTLLQLTAACRAAHRPAPALKAISLWIQRGSTSRSGATDELLEEARDLELALMLEAGNIDEALSLQLSRLTAAAPYPARDLDRAWLAARQAHQGSRFLPALERHLATYPEQRLSLTELAGQKEIPVEYLRWLGCHAAICDEEQPVGLALTSYLRLAAGRVAAALPRVCVLAVKATPALQKQAAEMLSLALDRAEMQTTVLNLAQEDAVARRIVETRLRQAPQNQALQYAATLAAATAALRKNTSVSLLWLDFLRRFPEDLSGRRRLIQAYIQDQQPALALKAYTGIPSRDLTAEDRQQQDLLRQM